MHEVLNLFFLDCYIMKERSMKHMPAQSHFCLVLWLVSLEFSKFHTIYRVLMETCWKPISKVFSAFQKSCIFFDGERCLFSKNVSGINRVNRRFFISTEPQTPERFSPTLEHKNGLSTQMLFERIEFLEPIIKQCSFSSPSSQVFRN